MANDDTDNRDIFEKALDVAVPAGAALVGGALGYKVGGRAALRRAAKRAGKRGPSSAEYKARALKKFQERHGRKPRDADELYNDHASWDRRGWERAVDSAESASNREARRAAKFGPVVGAAAGVALGGAGGTATRYRKK